MYLKRLQIKNFKSIREADIPFPPMTLVVGPNAAGKSNLISVFRFLSDVMVKGLDTAIALQGGMEFLANASLPRGTPIEISLLLDVREEKWIRGVSYRDSKTGKMRASAGLHFHEIQCSFVIIPQKRGRGYAIGHDSLKMAVDCVRNIRPVDAEKTYETIGSARLDFGRNKTSSVHFQAEFSGFSDEDPEVDAIQKAIQYDPNFLVFKRYCDENKKELLLSFISLLLHPSFSEESFIRVYDFDPRVLKRQCPIASAPTLEEDGSNLASVLKTISNSRKKTGRLIDLLTGYLPFAEAISVESGADKSFSYKVRERYSDKSFQQNYLSDGTVSVLAILTALYFQDQSILILEEPERNLHPRLLSSLLASAQDVSTKKQVILTTHNPEFLKHADISRILLASRNSDGFSTFSCPENSETVRTFIENDLGLDDLFLQDMLGA